MGVSRKRFIDLAKGGAALAVLSACAPNSVGTSLVPNRGLSGKSKKSVTLALDVKRSPSGNRWLWGNGKVAPKGARRTSVLQPCYGDVCGGGGTGGGGGGETPAGEFSAAGYTSYGYHSSNTAQSVDDYGNVLVQSQSSYSGSTVSTTVVGDTGGSATVTAPAGSSIPLDTVVNVSAAGTQGAQLYVDPSGTTGSAYIADYGTTFQFTYNADGSMTIHPTDGSPDMTITPDEMVALQKQYGYHAAITRQCIAATVIMGILVLIITILGIIIVIALRGKDAGKTMGGAAALNGSVWGARNSMCS